MNADEGTITFDDEDGTEMTLPAQGKCETTVETGLWGTLGRLRR